jgi:hypothetical protein
MKNFWNRLTALPGWVVLTAAIFVVAAVGTGIAASGGIFPKSGGWCFGDSGEAIGFYGATPVRKPATLTNSTSTVLADYSTNNVAAVTNVATQVDTPAAIVTNVLIQTATLDLLVAGGTTNTTVIVTNFVVQKVTTAALVTNVAVTTENALARAGTITNSVSSTNGVHTVLRNLGLAL